MYNSFGNILRITTFGESHGEKIGVVLDGLPAGMEIDREMVQAELNRRRPGQSAFTSPRQEEDLAEWVSGIFRGKTTGAPVAVFISNKDVKSEDYSPLEDVFRPSHADYTYQMKFGHRDHRGSGRASARETAVRVVAGAIAGQFLTQKYGTTIRAWVKGIGNIQAGNPLNWYTLEEIEASPVRCPDTRASNEMCRYIEQLISEGDSTGGVIQCVAQGMETGWGEPVYRKLQSVLAAAIFSLPAVKGFEIGSGFSGTRLRGSEHNDLIYKDAEGRVQTRTNHSGGVQGGISNGQDLEFSCAFKPVSTIRKSQETITKTGDSVQLEAKGRHDPCVVPRAVPVVEAMTRLVLADCALMNVMRKC